MIRRPIFVYNTPAIHTCDMSPYKDITTKKDFTDRYDGSTEFANAQTVSDSTQRLQADVLYNCLNQDKLDNSSNDQLISDISGIYTKITDYTDQKGVIDTYNEMNNSSLYYYKNDLKYVIFKIFFFIILIVTYIYFFKLTGIIEPVKRLINTIISKGDTFINKVTDKIKNPTVTDLKPKPTNVISTNVKPAPTNVIATNVKPTNVKPTTNNVKPNIPKPTNTNIKLKPKI
jgi:hypothetical protein